MTRGSNDHRANKVLEQYDEESSYKAKYESCERVEEESGYDEEETKEYGKD
jgi:hypothetical protein